jgi:hypothetical protein
VSIKQNAVVFYFFSAVAENFGQLQVLQLVSVNTTKMSAITAKMLIICLIVLLFITIKSFLIEFNFHLKIR